MNPILNILHSSRGPNGILFSLFLSTVVLLTSCAQDYTCQCYEKPGDRDPYTVTPIPDSKRSTAKEVCDNLNELASSSFPEAYCELK
ncbi:MAG: hypothetical protein KGQ80_06440 [Bacteroidetes bacterium]|nr:hypothetical protein [Bacteroidota bacterium]